MELDSDAESEYSHVESEYLPSDEGSDVELERAEVRFVGVVDNDMEGSDDDSESDDDVDDDADDDLRVEGPMGGARFGRVILRQMPNFRHVLNAAELLNESDDLGIGNEGATLHWGVSCDECGIKPLPGAVYHSTRIIDYDICEECYEGNHKHLTLADAFVVNTTRAESRAHGRASDKDRFEDPESLRVDVSSWEELEEKLQNNAVVQNLDVNLSMYDYRMEGATDRQCQAIRQRMASSSTLRVLYATFPGRGQEVHEPGVAALLEGIAANPSITTLSITLDFSWPAAVQCVCDLIRNNKGIRYMFLCHKRHTQSVRERLQEGARLRDLSREERSLHHANRQQEQQERKTQAMTNAALLFQALADGASVRSFICRGITDLGEDCRTAAVMAMRTRPSLKRIKAYFDVENEELEQLIEDKKENWMRGWNDPGASNESRVQIMEELLSCKQVDEEDQVAALFHFVRSNPGSLPELELEGMNESVLDGTNVHPISSSSSSSNR